MAQPSSQAVASPLPTHSAQQQEPSLPALMLTRTALCKHCCPHRKKSAGKESRRAQIHQVPPLTSHHLPVSPGTGLHWGTLGGAVHTALLSSSIPVVPASQRLLSSSKIAEIPLTSKMPPPAQAQPLPAPTFPREPAPRLAGSTNKFIEI